MKQDELNVLNQFEKLANSFKHILIADELLGYAYNLYVEIIEVRLKLDEVEKNFPTAN
jgi:hypothetical protein